MAIFTYSPNVLIVQTNLSGLIGDITDDPDSPTGARLTAAVNNETVCTVSFPTPSRVLLAGAGLQNFRVYVQANSTLDATFEVELLENGVPKGTISPTQNVLGSSTALYTYTWNGNLISDNSLVQCRINGHPPGAGNPSNRSSVEIGAIEWNASLLGEDIKEVDYITSANVKQWDNIAWSNIKTLNGVYR